MKKTVINILIILVGVVLIGGALGLRSYFAEKQNDLKVEPVEVVDGSVVLSVGEQALLDENFSFVLVDVLADNRCPANANCIEAGAVSLKLDAVYKGEHQEVYMSSDEVPHNVFHYRIRIVEVLPQLFSSQIIEKSEYQIQFEVADLPEDVLAHIQSKENLIRVFSPEIMADVSSPLVVSGEARGGWYFEATFPISIVNGDGLIIGEGYATAQGDWMTEEFVPWTGTINYTLPPNLQNTNGTIIFHKSNASGLPEHDDALEIPVRL